MNSGFTLLASLPNEELIKNTLKIFYLKLQKKGKGALAQPDRTSCVPKVSAQNKGANQKSNILPPFARRATVWLTTLYSTVVYLSYVAMYNERQNLLNFKYHSIMDFLSF